MYRSFKLCLFVFVFCLQTSFLKAEIPSLSWSDIAIQKMTLDEKIGQLFVVASVSNEKDNEDYIKIEPYTMHKEHIESLIKDYHVGGIIFLGTSQLAYQIERTQHYQKISKIPLFIFQDLEWGLSMRITDVLGFPKAMTLGALKDDEIIYEIGKEIGHQCRLIGVHMNLAPVVDVNLNPNNPIINQRSFGSDPLIVSQKSLAYMNGLRDGGVLSCCKHFPGHGDTSIDSHMNLPTISYPRDRLESIELYPFKQAILNNAPAIMVAHLKVPALNPDSDIPVSLSKNVVRDYLKGVLGFQGLVITDGLGMGGVKECFSQGDIELHAFLAGNDILLCPLDVPKAVSLIKNAISEDPLLEKDLDSSVKKILEAKQKFCHLSYSQEVTIDEEKVKKIRKQAYCHAITSIPEGKKVESLKNTPFIYIQFGGQEETTPYSLMDEFTLSSKYLFSKTASFDDLKTLLSLIQSHADQKHLVISFVDLVRNYRTKEKSSEEVYGVSSDVITCIQNMIDTTKNVTFIVFGSPYIVNCFDNCPHFLVTYESTEETHDSVIEILKGAFQPQGRLPVNLK